MSPNIYNILLVEDSAGPSTIKEAVARVQGFRIVSHVPDALAAVAYIRGQGKSADRERFPLPDILLLDLNAPRCADMEFVHWTQRRVLRPVLAAFSSLKRPEDSKLAEELQADLYEADISDANVFNRFLHFAGNIADLKRRGSI